MTRRIRNIGVLAHVDAGKTTLTEAMLHAAGSIRQPGNVDKGTSRSDTLDVERRRGISVRASALAFDWHDVRFHLIDTPGHVDFAAEVERSLRVLDAAVLVLSAVEGVQTQTETIWRALMQRGLPVLLFVNKIDRMGADSAGVVERIRRDLTCDVVPLNAAIDEGESHASIAEMGEPQRAQVCEQVAATDDELLDEWLQLDGNIPEERWRPHLARAVSGRALYPLLFGVAKNGIGAIPVLDHLVELFDDAGTDTTAPLSALVFRLDHDEKLGRIAGVRLFAGSVRPRDRIDNVTAQRQEQVTQIKRLTVGRLEDAPQLQAGDIGCVCGLPEVRIGDVLGDATPVPAGTTWTHPLLSVQVRPDDIADLPALAAACQVLASEDPHLDLRWYADERELHVRIMGPVQTEILSEILQTRFGLTAHFEAPTVIYKETPLAAGEGDESYTMPKPCWAIVKFAIEPAPPGTGVSYRSLVDKSDIHPKYQNEIAGRIRHALAQGPHGWEVTDLSIVLTEGCHHLLHSRPGDFKLATDMAILKALTATETRLLEPMLRFRVSAPQECIGRVTGDIVGMRGVMDPAQIDETQFTMMGRVPLATSMDYSIRLNSATAGRGVWSTWFDGYEPCPDGEGETRQYKGISPLDRAKYILWWRGAITDKTTG